MKLGEIPKSALNREIICLANDPDAISTIYEVIGITDRLIVDYPRLTFNDFKSVFPKVSSLQDRGLTFVRNAYRRYETAQLASAYFQKLLRADKKLAEETIRQQLGLPPYLPISTVSMYPHGMIIYCPKGPLNIFYKQSENNIPDSLLINGFTSNFYAVRDNGNHLLPVGFVRDDAGNGTTHHELTHMFFAQYYLGVQPRRKSRTIRGKKNPIDKLKIISKNEDIPQSFTEIKTKCLTVVARKLTLHRELFYNETIAACAGGSFSKFPGHAHTIAKSIDQAPLGQLESAHSYGSSLRAEIDANRKFILESNGTDKDKMDLLFKVELLAARFQLETDLIAEWITDLRTQYGDDPTSCVRALLSIPIHRVWAIGFFLSVYPRDLRRQLRTIPDTKIREKAYWYMGVKYAVTSAEKIYADNKPYVQDLDSDSQVRVLTEKIEEEINLYLQQINGFEPSSNTLVFKPVAEKIANQIIAKNS